MKWASLDLFAKKDIALLDAAIIVSQMMMVEASPRKWRSVEYIMVLPQIIYNSLYTGFDFLVRINGEVLKPRYIIF